MKKILGISLFVVVSLIAVGTAHALTLQPAPVTPGWTFLAAYATADNDKETASTGGLDPIAREALFVKYGFPQFPLELSGAYGLSQISNVPSGVTINSSTFYVAGIKYVLMGEMPGTSYGLFPSETGWPVSVALMGSYVSAPTGFSASGTTGTMTQTDVAYGGVVSKTFPSERWVLVPYLGLGLINREVKTDSGGTTTTGKDNLTSIDLGTYVNVPSLKDWWFFAEYNQVSGYKGGTDNTGRPDASKDSVFALGVAYVLPMAAPTSAQ